MMEEKCSNCKFYRVEGSEENKQGLGMDAATCKRFPHQYAVSVEFSESDAGSPVMWFQPTVLWDDWCGEFKEYGPA